MKLILRDNFYIYDIYHLVKAFFPDEKIEQNIQLGYKYFLSIQMPDGEEYVISERDLTSIEDRKEKKYFVGVKVYKYLCEYTGRSLAWGILTGIRPTKLPMKGLEDGWSDDKVVQYLTKRYLVQKEKAKLALDTAKREQALLHGVDYSGGYSLYIGIPFCPTTCAYCSFTSYPIEIWKGRVGDYLNALLKELESIEEMVRDRRLNTIYIGGGTPTTLTANQLHRLLSHIEQVFCLDHLLEFTVEAGRPDSITEEKLEVLKQHGISRISINPQTMQQKTLNVIGRKHTVKDVLEAYQLARNLGFDNINMDLIVGLRGEELADVEDTLQLVAELDPDSVTVHALAIKRAAKMGQKAHQEQSLQFCPEWGKKNSILEHGKQLSKMIQMAEDYATKMDMEPYYLYRQKNIAGNFENVGYAKVDKAGIYNILIMEEKQSILAAGAGAITKIVENPGNSGKVASQIENAKAIHRIENVKDVQEYISRIDEMIARKGEVLWH